MAAFDVKSSLLLFNDARPGKSILAIPYFSKVTEDMKKTPWLDVFSPMSVMQIQISNQIDGKTVSVKANVKVMDCIRLIEKTKHLSHRIVDMQLESGSGNETQKGTGATFRFGNYAGKTPAEVLASDGADALKKQRNFLAQNVAKYPDNQKIIDAIDEALSETPAQNEPKRVIVTRLIEPEFKYYVSDVDSKGRTRCYKLCITADLTEKTVNIEIMNGYATLSDVGNGLRKVDAKTFDPETKHTFRWLISWEAWQDWMQRLEWDVDGCARLWWASCRENGENATKKAREAANV